jgi:hypothetical protein
MNIAKRYAAADASAGGVKQDGIGGASGYGHDRCRCNEERETGKRGTLR